MPVQQKKRGILSALFLWVMRSDRAEPVSVSRVLAGYDVKEEGLEFFGDRATGTVADLPVVDFADRGDFCGGAAEKVFVCAIDFVTGDAFFDDFDACVFCQGDDGVACDAIQTAGEIGGVKFAVFDDEPSAVASWLASMELM